MPQPMTTEHPRWIEFCERLWGPEGLDFRQEDGKMKTKSNCDATGLGVSEKVLSAMGFEADAIAETLDYFRANGGYCDCEVLFNVDGGR